MPVSPVPPVKKRANKLRRGPIKNASDFIFRLGPGLITGAADDDPSGIATYSQVGSQFGMGMLLSLIHI